MDNNTYKVEFGRRLRQKREELKMTQQELADKLEYSKSFISRVESGIHEIPQSKVVLAAQVLHTSKEYLMGWTQDIDNRTGLSVEERQLISYYRSLNGAGKVAMMSMVQGLVDSGAYSEDTRSMGA